MNLFAITPISPYSWQQIITYHYTFLPWLISMALAIVGTNSFMQCIPEGYVFVCGSQCIPWAYNILWNKTDQKQCFLGTLVTSLSVHLQNETPNRTGSLNLFERIKRDLLAGVPDGRLLFGYALLPLWGVEVHQHILWILSKELIIIANEAVASIANLHKSLDF